MSPSRRSTASGPINVSDPLAQGAQDLDPATEFLYKPHTITFGAVGMLAIVYFSHAFSPPAVPSDPLEAADKSYYNSKVGVYAAVAFYLGYSVLQGPATSMVRPHPAAWRLIHGVLICYIVFLVFMLFQDVSDARQFLRHLFPTLGQDITERQYGTDCRLYISGEGINWPVIRDTMDEFVIAHTLGWVCKALIVRDWALLWIISVGFELMELTFQHMLPNFNECWWDSWILDVALCNFIGMWGGMKLVRYFKAKEYNWSGLSEQQGVGGKLKRAALQFTPYTFDDFDWRAFSTPARCLESLGLVVLFLLMEVHAFFLKYVLWIPPTNPLNTIRLLILFLSALPATKEYYGFITDPNTNFRKLGFFAWLYMALSIVETLIVIKFGRGMFPKPFPPHVIWFWGVMGSTFTALMLLWSYHNRRRSTEAKLKAT